MNPLTNDLAVPQPSLLSRYYFCIESNQVCVLWLGKKLVRQVLETVLKFIMVWNLWVKNYAYLESNEQNFIPWQILFEHQQSTALKKLKTWYTTNVALFKNM